MNPRDQDERPRLFTYDFTVLTLAATFGFCNIAVFYGLAGHLDRLDIAPAWRGPVIAAEPLAALLARPLLSVLLAPRQALTVARLGLAGLGLVLPCYLFASHVAALFAVRIAHGLCFVCLVSAIMALLAKTVPPKLSGRAFGYFSLSSLVPYALMPPLTEWLLPLLGGEARVYAVTALLTLPGLALLLPLGARLGPGALAGEENRPPSRRDILDNLGQTPILLLLGANLLVFAATTKIFFFIKPYAVSLGLPRPGLFFTVSTLASIAVRLLAGPYYDRLPRRLTAMLAMLALGACLGLFAWARSPVPFFVLAGAHGLCLGLALPLANASMFLESPPRFRAMNMNLMLFMMDAGYVLGPLAGGALVAGTGSFGALFLASAAGAAGAAALYAPLAMRELRDGR